MDDTLDKVRAGTEYNIRKAKEAIIFYFLIYIYIYYYIRIMLKN
jgi:hypothetical protein